MHEGVTVNLCVIVERGLLHRGVAQTVGTVLEVAPLVASELIASGRARLADDSDMSLVIDARKAQEAATMRQAAESTNIVGRLGGGAPR